MVFFLRTKGLIRRMIKVKTRGTESVEQMLKRFKKMCEKEGLTKEVKRNSYYEKPSDRKRRQMRKSVRQTIRKQRFGSR
jgi:small subunit ribosomal protein S21